MTSARLVGLIVTAVSSFQLLARAQPADEELKKARKAAYDRCLVEAQRRFGKPAAGPDEPSTLPKRRRGPIPSVPRNSAGLWVGQILVGPDGKVSEVWQVQGVSAEADVAMVKTIRKWEYDGSIVGGEPVPICLGFSLTLGTR